MKKYYLLILISIISILSIASLTTSSTSALHQPSPSDNYQKYCASCHGENLKSFIDRKWIYGNSWNEVFKSIKYGSPEDGMPAYAASLSDSEIKALTNYILKGIEDLTKEDFENTATFPSVIESEEQKFRIDTVVSNLSIPWGMAFLPNNELLFTERSGELYRQTSSGSLQKITGVPAVKAKGQGGLLDVTIHPNFKKNNYIYLSYSKPKGNQATTAVMRAKLKKNKLTDQKIIFEAQPYQVTRHHYGSRLVFDKKGYLYLSVGDRGRREHHPQYLSNSCGKIHRINDDGSIPKDNPFYNQKGKIASIYSYGHRNPQGLALHPETGKIWEHEHGPRGGDEVNIIQKGKNYGWPVISYGINYVGTKFTDITEKKDMEQPEKYWVPSIAPCGMTFVDSDLYPNWKNDLLVGSLRFDYIARLKMDGNRILKEEKLLSGIGRVRSIQMDREGYIYVAIEDPGYILRLMPL